MTGQPITLLDAGRTGRRLLQQFVPLAGLLVLLGGIFLLVAGRHGGSRAPGAGLMVAGIGIVCCAPLVLVQWEVDYKGHRIRFENNPVLGERLFIDGERFSAGALGYEKTLEGTIRSGDGAGDRITAHSTAGPVTFRCRIVAEPR